VLSETCSIEQYKKGEPMENATKGLLHYFNGSIIKALLYPIFGVIVLINIIIVIWEMGYLNKIKKVSLEERKQDLVVSVQKIVNDFPENQPDRLNLILSNLTSNAIAEQIIVFNHQGIALASSRESALNQHMDALIPQVLLPVIRSHYAQTNTTPIHVNTLPLPGSSLPVKHVKFSFFTGSWASSLHARALHTNVLNKKPVQLGSTAFNTRHGLIYVTFNASMTTPDASVFLQYEMLFLLSKLFLVILMIYSILQRQISYPIHTLLSACRKAVKTGRFELKDPLPSNEFNQLSLTFQWAMRSLRENQAELDQAKTKLEAIFRSVQESILTIDTRGMVQSANSAVLPTFGYQVRELLDRPLSVLLPAGKASLRQQHNIVEQIAHNPNQINFGKAHQLEGTKRSGERFPILLKITPGEANNERFYTVFIQDLSDQVNIERKLAENQALFKAAVNSSLLGFALQKTDGTIIEVNPSLSTLLGYSEHNLIGMPLDFLISDASQEITRHHWDQLKSGATNEFSCDCLFQHKNGGEVWSILSSTTVRSPLTGEDFVVTQVVDITKEKTLSMRIAQRNIELKRSNDDLYNFAHSASHDLKSPLNAIGNIVGWIEDDCGDILPAASRQHLNILKSRCDRMKKLLDDLLGYSRIGKLDFSEQSINIGIMAREIFELQEDAHRFTLTTDKTTLMLPRVPLEIILRNLISNAIRHHNQGNGHIEVKCQKRKEYYHISVFDDGPGIPSELHERAMEMFQTLRPRDEVEGSGIGLAMINKLLEHFHGRLEIHENGAQGTEMRVVWLINWKEFDATQA